MAALRRDSQALLTRAGSLRGRPTPRRRCRRWRRGGCPRPRFGSRFVRRCRAGLRAYRDDSARRVRRLRDPPRGDHNEQGVAGAGGSDNRRSRVEWRVRVADSVRSPRSPGLVGGGRVCRPCDVVAFSPRCPAPGARRADRDRGSRRDVGHGCRCPPDRVRDGRAGRHVACSCRVDSGERHGVGDHCFGGDRERWCRAGAGAGAGAAAGRGWCRDGVAVDGGRSGTQELRGPGPANSCSPRVGSGNVGTPRHRRVRPHRRHGGSCAARR